jgi:hypothetical protein
MNKQERGELQGLIQIEATEGGEQISIMGAFADRMQYGALMLIKALGIVGNKIENDPGIGDSYSSSIRETHLRKKRGQPRRLREYTGFGELTETPPRRAR